MSRTKRRILWSLLVVGVIALFQCCTSRFTGIAVCLQCGATSHFTHWSLPLSQTKWRRSSKTHENAFSHFVTSQHLVPAHEHTWLFARGNGTGIMGKCALGDGMEVLIAVDRKPSLRLLEALHGYGFNKERDELLGALLTPEQASAAMGLAFEFEGVSTEEELNRWLDKSKDLWTKMRIPANQ